MSEQDEKLDQLLRQWDQHSSAESLESLQDRISSALANEQAADAIEDPRPLPAEPAKPSATAGGGTAVLRAGVVVAALLLLAVSLWWQPWRGGPAADPGPLEFAQFSEDQLAGQAKLLAEMDLIFDGQLSWVAESDGQVRMGIAESPASNALETNGRPVAIRVVVARRDKGRSDWRRLWTVDVVSCSQQVVRWDPKAEDDLQIALWAYVLPDGMIAVDSSISARGVIHLEANSNGVQEPRRPAEVAVQDVDGAEYRVFQTVALLKEA